MMLCTPDALHLIRDGLQRGTSPDSLRRQLGWPVSMFNNICNRNRIDAVVALDDAMPPRPLAVTPVRITNSTKPAKVMKPGETIAVTVSLTFEALDKLDRMSRRVGITRNRAVCEIVYARVLCGELHKVQLARRARNGEHGETKTFSIQKSMWETLDQQARVRIGKVSVGMLVKAILYEHFGEAT